MSDIPHFLRMIKRAPRADVVILLITFLLTVFTNLIIAVNVGVILAILHFIHQIAQSVEVKQATLQDLQQELALEELPPDVLVFTIEGPFFFAAVESFVHNILSSHIEPQVLILRLKRVPFIDITGIQALEETILNLHQRGVKVMLTEMNDWVKHKLTKSGLVNLVGNNRVFEQLNTAVIAIKDNRV